MSKVTTKIGDIEITPGIAKFLNNMLRYDINTYIVNGYINELRDIQDYLTRMLVELCDPDPEVLKSHLSTIMATRDQLTLLLPGKTPEDE